MVYLTDFVSWVQKTVHLTKHGMPAEILTTRVEVSSFDQLVFEISVPYASPEYGSIIIMYICIILVFMRIKIGLCKFSI